MAESSKKRDPFPEAVMEELRNLLARVQTSTSAERLLQRVLTPLERSSREEDLTKAYKRNRTVGMWMCLRGGSQPRAIVDVARELNFIDEATKSWLLREIGESEDTSEEAIEAAVKSTPLVLVEQGRTVYWQGKMIEVDWHTYSALWDFLWLLCERAKSGAGVDYMLLGKGVKSGYLSKTKHRLCGLDEFPQELELKIDAKKGGVQQLDLPPSQIRLFKIATLEILREVTR